MFEYEYDLKAFEECAEKYGTFIARLNHSPYLSMMRWTSEFFVCVFNISIIPDNSSSLKNLARTLISHRIIFFLKSESGILALPIKQQIMVISDLMGMSISMSGNMS